MQAKDFWSNYIKNSGRGAEFQFQNTKSNIRAFKQWIDVLIGPLKFPLAEINLMDNL
jgi:hypothetical protein